MICAQVIGAPPSHPEVCTTRAGRGQRAGNLLPMSAPLIPLNLLPFGSPPHPPPAPAFCSCYCWGQMIGLLLSLLLQPWWMEGRGLPSPPLPAPTPTSPHLDPLAALADSAAALSFLSPSMRAMDQGNRPRVSWHLHSL